jgi:hypothetical protein
MGVAVAAEFGKLDDVADVVADHHLIAMPTVQHPADRLDAHPVIRHVDVGMGVVGVLLTEQVPFQHHARIRQAE